MKPTLHLRFITREWYERGPGSMLHVRRDERVLQQWHERESEAESGIALPWEDGPTGKGRWLDVPTAEGTTNVKIDV